MSDIPIATISGNKTVSDILTNKTLIYMLIFLACYSVIYLVLGVLYGGSAENTAPLRIARIIDVIILIIIVIYLIASYANTSVQSFGDIFAGSLSSFKEFVDNPFSIFTVVIFLLALYTVIFVVKIPMTAALKPLSIMIIEMLALLLFVALLFVDFFKYVLKIDLLDLIFDGLINSIRSPTPVSTTEAVPKSTCPGETSVTGETPAPEGEVFNIRNNLYTYDEAREVCSLYGAKLATYDQVEDAYNNGGEWCNYGWSEGQMALFPTQKSTWDALQKDVKPCSGKGNMSCGRPGINGGIIKNPKIRFGINCYGKKPAPSDSDKALMKANVEIKQPESKEDANLKAKMKVWKENADKFLLVNSFNKTKWSEDV